MKIESIEAIAIVIPLKRNFGGSTYAVTKRCTVITRARTDDGLASEVYNGDNREHGREIVRLIHEELAPRVSGKDVLEVEKAWHAMFGLTHTSRDRKTLLEAISCVDFALWDLVGRARGKSVCELLGGTRDRLPIISIGGYYMEGKTLADYGREMEQYREAGMAGCKFKVGGLAPEEDLKRVQAARDAAGPDFVLVVPPDQYLGQYVFFTDPTYPETNLVVVRARGTDNNFHDVMLDCGGAITGWTPIGSGCREVSASQ